MHSAKLLLLQVFTSFLHLLASNLAVAQKEYKQIMKPVIREKRILLIKK